MCARVVGEGPPLLLLHGFGGSVDAWPGEVLDVLSGRFRLVAVDLPGHGRSPAGGEPSGYALEAVVSDLGALLDSLGVARAHWVGYSMGGRVALGAAVLAPERVERLVLEGASPGLADPDVRERRRAADEALATQLERGGMEAFVDAWMAQPLFASQTGLPEPLRAAERARRLRNRPETLAACLRGLGTGAQPSFWERLGEVRAPTLLLTGERDERFTEIARQMQRRLPRSRRVVVEGAGHAVHLEKPRAWLEAVTSFLDPMAGGGT